MQKGRRIRLPHRSQRPFQFSEPRPGGRASEIDLFFKQAEAKEEDSAILSGSRILALSHPLSSANRIRLQPTYIWRFPRIYWIPV